MVSDRTATRPQSAMRGVAQLINTLFGVSICERSLCGKRASQCRSAEDSSELQCSDKSDAQLGDLRARS